MAIEEGTKNVQTQSQSDTDGVLRLWGRVWGVSDWEWGEGKDNVNGGGRKEGQEDGVGGRDRVEG